MILKSDRNHISKMGDRAELITQILCCREWSGSSLEGCFESNFIQMKQLEDQLACLRSSL